MTDTTAPTRFPFTRTLLMLALAAVAMGLLAFGAVHLFFGASTQNLPAVLFSAILCFVTSVLGLIPLAIMGSRGTTAAVGAYFMSMMVRMPVCLLLAAYVVRTQLLPANPVLASMGLLYMSLLMIEVAAVSRYLWSKDINAKKSQPHTPDAVNGVVA